MDFLGGHLLFIPDQMVRFKFFFKFLFFSHEKKKKIKIPIFNRVAEKIITIAFCFFSSFSTGINGHTKSHSKHRSSNGNGYLGSSGDRSMLPLPPPPMKSSSGHHNSHSNHHQDKHHNHHHSRGLSSYERGGETRHPQSHTLHQLQPDFYFMPHQRRYSGEVVRVFVDHNNMPIR